MATRKQKSLDLNSQTDPKAPLDGAALLRAAKPVLTLLQADLLERADSSPNVTATLREQHERALKADRTADDYLSWRRNFVEQVAAAWFLSVVFVRTLEDRNLIARNRIAGEGALDSQKSFFALAPSLSERDYLLTVFRELSHLPAAADLFDARHNPVWLLAPSAHAAQQLLQLFRTPSDVAPAFRFGGDTRFLGDLYQDLSEDVRARYALLQTPHFVESFILDQTLEPAIERFGLNDATLIDPTCGSGHFLLGAFDRLLTHRLSAEPGVDVRQAARKALDAVSGTDINPYAVSIARFRLTLSFLERAGYTQLRDAPKLPLHLAVADSLLHNYQHGLDHATGDSDKYQQTRLGETATTDIAAWEGDLFTLEDLAQTREVLGRRYAAVVGNPPYITVKDAKLRDKYRELYSAAFREYSLAVPFKQRFFQLGRQGGYIGMITANSFMKREFGKKVIQEFLPGVNLTTIINTSGAYIPGHGTPTVLLFGTAEKPVNDEVLTVLANRGEPSTPDDAEQGYVWRSIADHYNEIGFENEYISVARTERAQLGQHPWSLGGGGASELKQLLEQRSECTLGEVAAAIGFSVITGEDNVLMGPASAYLRAGVPEHLIRRNVIGEEIRDWTIADGDFCIWPCNDHGERLDQSELDALLKYLWPFRTALSGRKAFGQPIASKGIPWWALREVYSERMRTPLTITFAFVATHNHFVLDRGGKVFKQSAPIIKLPASAAEDDHYALLAYLNSSTACFWMKQVMQPKHSAEHATHPAPERNRFEHSGTIVGALPIPMGILEDRELSRLGHETSDLAQKRRNAVESLQWSEADRIRERMLVLQEDIDWHVYALFGLVDRALASSSADDTTCPRGSRPFELQTPRVSFVTRDSHERPLDEFEVRPHADRSPELDHLWTQRLEALRESSALQMIEQALYKRQWRDTDANVDEHSFRRESTRRHHEGVVLDALENTMRVADQPTRIAAGNEGDSRQLALGESVPYLAAHRYTESGLEKYAVWERTWDIQRQEDAGKSVGDIPVPPKYDNNDFAAPHYWSLRGKLDVPKERFIAYPGCESDEDGQPIYGWAGWNHRERAVALATLYTQRKSEEGWKKERLQPMLAGLLELLPWLDQWHNQPDADFDGAIPASQFREFLDAESAEHGFTYDDLRNWRPTRTAGGKKKAATSSASAGSSDETPARKPKRAAKSRAPSSAAAVDGVPASNEDGSLQTPEPHAKPKRTRKSKAATTTAGDSASDDAVEASV